MHAIALMPPKIAGEKTCAQLKVRKHMHNSANWEEHVYNSNWEKICTTQTERRSAQLKLREHKPQEDMHNLDWGTREHTLNFFII